jgi:predicted GNAT family acetyltransferase
MGMAEGNYPVLNNEKEMLFEITERGEKAYLTYRYYKGDLVLMHTSVPPVREGKGIA